MFKDRMSYAVVFQPLPLMHISFALVTYRITAWFFHLYKLPVSLYLSHSILFELTGLGKCTGPHADRFGLDTIKTYIWYALGMIFKQGRRLKTCFRYDNTFPHTLERLNHPPTEIGVGGHKFISITTTAFAIVRVVVSHTSSKMHDSS